MADSNNNNAIGDTQLLLRLLEQGAAQGEALKQIATNFDKLANQHTSLIERVSKMETLNGVQGEQIRQLTAADDKAAGERATLDARFDRMNNQMQWYAGGLAAVFVVVEVISWVGPLLGWF